MINLGGVFPPLPTAFGTHDELLTDKLQENIRSLNQYALRGYLILGSNGELINLSEEEKNRVYVAAREAIPHDKLMLAGTGGQSTSETLKLTAIAASAGADAVLILNPSYYRGLMNRVALVSHYHEIADHSDIPVIIYNMPANSGLDMDAETIVEISSHENIIGLKDSGGNLTKMAQIIDETDDDFQVLAGSAGFLVPAMSIGAVGGILALANISPEHCMAMHTRYLAGDFKGAAHFQRKCVKLNNAVTRGWGVPALKAAMDHLGLYGGPCRKPIQNLDQEKAEVLFKLVRQLNEQTLI